MIAFVEFLVVATIAIKFVILANKQKGGKSKGQSKLAIGIKDKESYIDKISPLVNRTPADSVLRDDKKNDWLSKQLEEERRAYRRTSELFNTDLASEHSQNCDARELALEHRTDCDAKSVMIHGYNKSRK